MPPPSEPFPAVPPPPEDLSPHAAVPPLETVPPGGRLHPAAMVLWPLGQIGPLVFLFVAGRLQPVIGGVVLAALVLTSVLRWLRFSWRLEHGALVIEQGLLARRRRVIPRDRIQSVDVVRKLRHRAVGVVELRVEAVGGNDAEGRLEALRPAIAAHLRAVLLGEASAHGVAERAHEGTPLVRVPPRDLVVAGLTGGRVGVMAALLGFAQELLGERVDELARRAPAVLGLRGIVAVAAGLLVVAFALSIVATIVVYWDFTLSVDGPRLRVRRGLLQQRSETVPLRRIQALRVEENLVRRVLGLAAVKVDVAGRARGEDAQQAGLLLPLRRRRQALALVGQVLRAAGHSDASQAPLEPMPARARSRRLLRAVVPVLVVTGALVWWRGGGWSPVLLALGPAVAWALDAYRALGVGRVGDTLVMRSGVLVRRTAFVPVGRVQALALSASPVQRRQRLATLELQVARSPGTWSGPRMIDVDVRVADRWLAGLAREIAAPRTLGSALPGLSGGGGTASGA